MSNENNNNNDKKGSKRSLYNILDREGFYIILFLCVCIVAVVGIWVSNQDQNNNLTEEIPKIDLLPDITLVEDNEEDEEINETAGNYNNEIAQKGNQNEEKSSHNQLRSEGNKPVSEENSEAQEDTVQVVSLDNYTRPLMSMPVIGRIGLPFADDRLVFHKTLQQWSTHKGIDIHGELGAPVRAALDGEVIEILNDTILGITITLQHDDNILTRYSNLSTDAMVQLGSFVKKGQVISGIGRTASVKSEEGPLLHFQVIYDGRHVNPEDFLPRMNN